MYIANPIYDVALNYLLDDATAAKIFLSQIIGEQIVELALTSIKFRLPCDETTEITRRRKSTLFTVMHRGFVCRLCDAAGTEKTVNIELQKAKLSTDLMRFRRYVGSHYQRKNEKTPLYYVYVLTGDYDDDYLPRRNDDLPRRPVLKIDNDVSDADTGEKLSARGSKFIRELTHKSWVIQIRYLPEERLTKLDQLLAIFDQRQQENNGHFLDIDEQKFPAEFEPVWWQLLKAQATKQVRDSMIIADDYWECLESAARGALDAQEECDRQRAKRKVAEEKQRTKQERQRAELAEQ